MKRRAAFACVALLLVALAGCAATASKASLDGRWQPVTAELDGAALPIESFRGAVLELADGRYAFGIDRGRYALVDGSPPAMDIDGVAGPNAGKRLPAIYRVDGDALVVCYQLGGGPRPTAFRSAPASKTLLVTYRRG